MHLDNVPNLDKPSGQAPEAKVPTPSWATAVAWVAVGIPTIAFVSCMVGGGGDPLGSASEARVQCASRIEQRLRDPSSVEWIDRPSWPATRAANGMWTVHANYRARNGFGGMNVEAHTCQLWKASGQWSFAR